MSIAIIEDHRALGRTASDFLAKHDARGAARRLLEAPAEELPEFWSDLAALGWLGLHLPEEHGGSGYGLPELVVVVEELGRAVAPGPFLPTVIASAVIATAGPDALQSRLLPMLADGSTTAGVALTSDVAVSGGRATGTALAVLGAGLAQVLVLPAGDDAVVVDAAAGGVTVSVPANLDPTRRTGRVTLEGAPAEVIPGGRRALVDLGRLLLAAEATGVATECTEQAAAYAKVRLQFGRPIAMFQAVKHHCANMLVASELATATVWDAARAAQHPGTRRHRLHVGARLPPVSPPRHCPRGAGRPAEGGVRRHRPRPRRRQPVPHRRPSARVRTDARRGPPVRRAHQGAGRRRPARRADRDRLRDAALAQAVGPRRRRRRAAGD
jgi:alkylation response protein AidB-like acyl-CoA dehydrogenase